VGHFFIRYPSPAVYAIMVLGAMNIGAAAGAFLGSLIAGIIPPERSFRERRAEAQGLFRIPHGQ
jgi:hypothetical protein